MDRSQRTSRLVALFVLGLLLFNYPLIATVNRIHLIFGVPILYAYLFLTWAGLILLLALALRSR